MKNLITVMINVDDFTITGISSGFPEQVGLKEADVMVNHFCAVTGNNPCEAASIICPLHQAVASGQSQEFNYTLGNREGEKKFIDTDICPIANHQGRITGLVLSSTIVTDEAAAEDPWLKEMAGYKNLFGSISDGVYSIDAPQ